MFDQEIIVGILYGLSSIAIEYLIYVYGGSISLGPIDVKSVMSNL